MFFHPSILDSNLEMQNPGVCFLPKKRILAKELTKLYRLLQHLTWFQSSSEDENRTQRI